jgi:hypothetical protein
MSGDFPVIDIAAVRQPQVSAAARLEIARRVASACEEIGFFAVTGQGVPGAVIADLVAQSYALDQRPLALDPASGRQPTGGHERSQSAPVDRHVLYPKLRCRCCPIAGLGEASKYRPITAA